MTRFVSILLLVLVFASVSAHDYPPGEKQTAPVLIKGGTLFTISNGALENTDILFENGRITQIAADIESPEGAQVVDATGKYVYPGLIAMGTQVGLIEVGAVQASDDRSEMGKLTPDVQSHVAYNPDSEVIPTTRSNGIAYVQVVPGGSLLMGRSCLLNLDAWTKEDAAVELNVGLHLNWPGVGISTSWWERRPPEKQLEDQRKNRQELRQAFRDALAYKKAKEADPGIDQDSRWEAMLPIFSSQLPVYVHADDSRQIEEAVLFAEEFGFKMILVGGREAWKVSEMLKAHDIPVILCRTHALPYRADDPYDQAFRLPAQLNEAGVKIAFGVFGATGVRNMPFDAAQAVAFGLPAEVALRAMTLSPAEILGVDGELGSLEVGKRATIIISEGDVMNHLTHGVTHMWIDGRAVNLDNKHKELYRKYQVKQLQ